MIFILLYATARRKFQNSKNFMVFIGNGMVFMEVPFYFCYDESRKWKNK